MFFFAVSTLLLSARTVFGQSANDLAPFSYTLCTTSTSCVQRSTYLISTNGLADVTSSGNALTTGYNRLILVDPTKLAYEVFKLKNRQLSFTFDISAIPCGSNAAMYFSDMNLSQAVISNSGYCDAQQDCMEFDVIEANVGGQQYTAHPCTLVGPQTGNSCSAWGCDVNTMNSTQIGPNYASGIDVTKPFNVITQFITSDNTDAGTLTSVVQTFTQGSFTLQLAPITEALCLALPANQFDGGLPQMSLGLDAGMTFILSVWQAGSGMDWLDGGSSNPKCSALATPATVSAGFSNFILAPIGTNPATIVIPTTTTSSSPTPSLPCAALYGQCGGTQWTGTTCCVSGAVCSGSTSYYQCVPGTSSTTQTSTTVPTTTTTTTTKTTTTTTAAASTTTTTTTSATKTTTTTLVPSSSTTTTSATTAKSTATTTAANCAVKYGECGGIGWTGATCCVSSTCTFVNAYYSQCL
ncbi:hypothetical protein HK100_005762 [Physocladia obscura]|uniref:Glucanase n=1 Tax=Physocladia obscura TaxID=109957 RepID=A0AAD5XBQ5_9FUNG|nr:hypothetical protein HK100_005762 [Physocladia obscura]